MLLMSRVDLPLLSKSRFLAGLQCFKRLDLECYAPHHGAAPSPNQAAILDFGIATGVVARGLYPGGVLVADDNFHHADAVQHTAELLAQKEVEAIFEAAFTEDDVRVRVDVLKRGQGGLWTLVEVKASSSVRDDYIDDVAVQLITVERAGLRVQKTLVAHLAHVDPSLAPVEDWRGSFVVEDVTAQARHRAEYVPAQLAAMREALRGVEAPPIAPGAQCTIPYRCRFFSYCHDA